MNEKRLTITDKLLFPFVFIYKGFITILLSPYYFVKFIINLFGGKKNKNKTVIAEPKKQDTLKVVNVNSNANNTLKSNNKSVNNINTTMSNSTLDQKRKIEFEKLIQKERIEEAKRAKEQERLMIENEKRALLIKKKEEERRLREEKEQEIQDKLIEEKKKRGEPITFSDKLKKIYKKLTYNKKEELELAAKKEILNETFKDKNSQTSRFKNPLLFTYVAKNKNGEIEKSTIEAQSRLDVHSFLEAEGYEVYEISVAKAVNKPIGSFKLKKNRLIFYLSQLSAYLKSGIALSSSVKILEEQASKNINEKKVWRAVYYDLSMGDNLSLALQKRKDAFPKLLINMIKTAEMTGNLSETLDDMVEYYTESEQTKRQMKSAMLYPTVITVFAIAVITFILMWVVPQFVDIYNDLGSDIPMITKVVISISGFLKNYLLYILLIIIVLALIYIYLFKNVKSFRKSMQTFMMHIPIFGKIIIYNEVTIFTKTFANLVNHNVFITDSIDVLIKITDNEIYKKLIFDTSRNLTKGDNLSSAFKDHWAFPNIAYQMLITGEKTGRLGPMLERVSDYYQEQHKAIITQMKTLIEPILIVALAVIVGAILLSVIIPMYGMYDAL